jgi:hypothetical protein
MRFAFLLLSLCSCATAPTVLFTSFGRADPAGDADIVDTWKQDRSVLLRNAKDPEAKVKLKSGREVTVREFAKKRVDATRNVDVLVDTMPAGVELSDRSASVKDGSGLELIGRFTIRYDSTVALSEALDDVKVLTQASGGNLAVVSWLRASQTETAGVVGFALKANDGAIDPKNFKSGHVNEL